MTSPNFKKKEKQNTSLKHVYQWFTCFTLDFLLFTFYCQHGQYLIGPVKLGLVDYTLSMGFSIVFYKRRLGLLHINTRYNYYVRRSAHPYHPTLQSILPIIIQRSSYFEKSIDVCCHTLSRLVTVVFFSGGYCCYCCCCCCSYVVPHNETPLAAAALIICCHLTAAASRSVSLLRILSVFSRAHLSYRVASISMYIFRTLCARPSTV